MNAAIEKLHAAVVSKIMFLDFMHSSYLVKPCEGF